MINAGGFWHDQGAVMFYLLGVIIIASGSILLMGLASRNPPPSEATPPEADKEF